MAFVGFLILFGAVALLWRKVVDLDARHEQLRDYVAELSWGVEPRPENAAPAPPQREPAAMRVSTPIPASRIAAPPPEPDEPLPVEEPEPASVAVEEGESEIADLAPGRRFDFEDLFGRLLPIWAGGVTLAVAGFFIVRYTIERGMLTPEVRVLLGFLFGFVLLGAAELAYRFEARVADERVRQALAGAGLATLYASIYLAGTRYGLIGATLAFTGLAAVTAGAIALSFRFGLPSAVLGLVGGFAAPALVASDQANVPLLTLYLALVAGGLMLTGRRRRWAWLGIAALGGGLGWGVLLLVTGIAGQADLIAMGGYLVVLGVLLPAFALTSGARPHPLVDAVAALLASMQMAAMVEQGGYSMLVWGLYGLLGAALAVLGWRNLQLRRASAVAALLGLAMLELWPQPDLRSFAIVAAGFVAIFGAVPLALVWRGRHQRVDVGQLCVFALGTIGVAASQFGDLQHDVQPGLAMVSAGLALLPAIAAWKLWPPREHKADPQVLGAVGATALAMFAAGYFAAPHWSLPLVAAAIALALVALVARRQDGGLFGLAWAAALTAFFVLLPGTGAEDGVMRMFGLSQSLSGGDLLPTTWHDPLRWFALVGGFGALAAFEFRRPGRASAEVLAALCTYGALAQLLPADALAWAMAGAAIALVFALPERRAAQATSLALAAGWAVAPVAIWGLDGIMALSGEPMLIAGVLGARDMLLQLAPGFAAGAVLAWRHDGARQKWGRGALALLAAVGLVALHILYKQVFGLAEPAGFVRYGMAERTLWEALLLALAYGAWSQRARFAPGGAVGVWLATAALLHFAAFTLVLHNPLWATQQVGPTPVANLLLPAYGLAVAAVLALRNALPPHLARGRIAADGVTMGLLTMLAISLLRQAYSGTLLLAAPMTQSEDMLRSLLGIVLAIGFLLWGTRRGLRSWRVGSLVLMLGAVLKVFLVDAAVIEGLARIGSFVALGFSLIGIGWFYSRQLKPR